MAAGSVASKHQGATPVAYGVGDDEPACEAAGHWISVSVLESLQLLPVTVPEVDGARLNMDVVHVTRAIGEAGDGVEQR